MILVVGVGFTSLRKDSFMRLIIRIVLLVCLSGCGVHYRAWVQTDTLDDGQKVTKYCADDRGVAKFTDKDGNTVEINTLGNGKSAAQEMLEAAVMARDLSVRR